MADIKRVSPEQAKKLIEEEGYLYLDVRSEPEYAAGHPSGAHNVPLLHAGPGGMKPNPDFLDVVSALYPKDAKIIVGCRSGQRSMRAAEAMVAAGFTAVIDQRAGFEGPRDAFGALTERGWGPAGLPVETTTPGASYAELRQKAGR
ncbi:rhodanese-like domain-containing protein [Sorangium sp. So ce1024]|uniref:rhodanese-like domain-containing protein n=1 Tax=unclassified Sorangium TaxID=2621164 RepID=UPI003F0B0959